MPTPDHVPEFGDRLFANQGDSYFKEFPAIAARTRAEHILEVGSWAGHSLAAWAKAAPYAKLWAVDTWKPYLPDDNHVHITMAEAARSGEIERLFWTNMQTLGLEDRIIVMKGSSIDILPRLRRESFDIVFLDGDHSYNIILRDIINSMGLVRIGGIICGDDLDKQLSDLDYAEHQEVMSQPGEMARSRSGLHYHHGVVQAVHDVFGRVQCFDNRLWVVQRIEGGWSTDL